MLPTDQVVRVKTGGGARVVAQVRGQPRTACAHQIGLLQIGEQDRLSRRDRLVHARLDADCQGSQDLAKGVVRLEIAVEVEAQGGGLRRGLRQRQGIKNVLVMDAARRDRERRPDEGQEEQS